MTAKNTIDTALAKRMVEAQVIRSASIIGLQGGWSVTVKVGVQEKTLGAQRTDKPRLWKSLDRCVDYLKNELHIARVELLDATDFSAAPSGDNKNKAGERMRQAHAAAAYDKWLKTEIQAAIDDPRPNVEHDEVMRRANERIAAIKLRQSFNV
ncbi:MAG: hypothetical protein WC742_01700 [Gallionellaceae bacterium]|jgi:hypothetical protein